ncbi:MAG: hypothetical protein R2822_30425 [Spirosomataceae bacterium]
MSFCKIIKSLPTLVPAKSVNKLWGKRTELTKMSIPHQMLSNWLITWAIHQSIGRQEGHYPTLLATSTALTKNSRAGYDRLAVLVLSLLLAKAASHIATSPKGMLT